jgi:hypothetical protein
VPAHTLLSLRPCFFDDGFFDAFLAADFLAAGFLADTLRKAELSPSPTEQPG